jgi:hypothetical protein
VYEVPIAASGSAAGNGISLGTTFAESWSSRHPLPKRRGHSDSGKSRPLRI